jgi:hypothetical protein
VNHKQKRPPRRQIPPSALHNRLRISKDQQKDNTAIMSLTNCRFYEEKYPDVDSLVMVNVRQVAEMGA